jgi:hypothetical protein
MQNIFLSSCLSWFDITVARADEVIKKMPPYGPKRNRI